MTDPTHAPLPPEDDELDPEAGVELPPPSGGCGRAGCGFLAGVLGSALITLAILATVLTRGHPLALAAGLARAGEGTPTSTSQLQSGPALSAAPPPVTAAPAATNTYIPIPTAKPTSTPTPSPTPSPTPTATPTPMISLRQVNALGRYETMQFVVQTVVDLAHEPNNLWQRICGTDQLLLVAGGEVIAGFDLSKVQPSDIQVAGKSLKLQLPPAEVLSYSVREDQTYVYQRNTGLLCRADPNLETEARRQAQQRVLDYALAQGILPKAQNVGLTQLEAFFRDLGFDQVELTIKPRAPTD